MPSAEATATPSPVGKNVDLIALTRDVRALGFEIVSGDAYALLVKRAKRASRTEAALVRIFGLLTHRRWWNDNVWAAREIAKDVLLDTGGSAASEEGPS